MTSRAVFCLCTQLGVQAAAGRIEKYHKDVNLQQASNEAASARPRQHCVLDTLVHVLEDPSTERETPPARRITKRVAHIEVEYDKPAHKPRENQAKEEYRQALVVQIDEKNQQQQQARFSNLKEERRHNELAGAPFVKVPVDINDLKAGAKHRRSSVTNCELNHGKAPVRGAELVGLGPKKHQGRTEHAARDVQQEKEQALQGLEKRMQLRTHKGGDTATVLTSLPLSNERRR